MKLLRTFIWVAVCVFLAPAFFGLPAHHRENGVEHYWVPYIEYYFAGAVLVGLAGSYLQTKFEKKK